MLYYLFDYLEKNFDLPGAGLFQFVTFRAAVAIILSLLISILIGKRIIRFLQKKQVGEEIRDLDLAGQMEKRGTPTMGGIIILLAILIPALLLTKLDNIYIQLMLLSTVWMGLIGFTDDYIKVFKKNKDGLRGRFKIMGQVGLGLIVGSVMYFHNDVVVRVSPQQLAKKNYQVIDMHTPDKYPALTDTVYYVKSTVTNVPFFKKNQLEYSALLGIFGEQAKKYAWVVFILLVIFIVTAVSNAANLTDGLDGLATGTSAIIGATLAVLAYVSGHALLSDYLNILYLPYTSELVVFAACFLGACIGFLWYNAYPAQVFMGDTGSLAIGGIIAALAIVLRKELLIPILCGIFLVENLSVMMQVAYFKYTKRKFGEGKRIFLMSPLHHHFQKKNIPEPKIVARFWIIGVILAALTIVTLKIR